MSIDPKSLCATCNYYDLTFKSPHKKGCPRNEGRCEHNAPLEMPCAPCDAVAAGAEADLRAQLAAERIEAAEKVRTLTDNYGREKNAHAGTAASHAALREEVRTLTEERDAELARCERLRGDISRLGGDVLLGLKERDEARAQYAAAQATAVANKHLCDEVTALNKALGHTLDAAHRETKAAEASLAPLLAVTRAKCDVHHGARMECGQCYDSQAQHLKNALASRRALAMRVAERVNQANGTLGPEGLKFAVAEVEASHG